MVNTMLVMQTQGKGLAVQKNVLRRMGARLQGQKVMTKGQMRSMMDDEDAVRAIIHQLMCVGQNIRSRPMDFARGAGFE